MKKVINCLLTIFLFLTLESCEGYRCSDGIVADKLTSLPLDSVLCDVITGSKKYYTDSSGKFDLCNRFGPCMPCKDIIIKFSRRGYKTKLVENPLTASVIYLERE